MFEKLRLLRAPGLGYHWQQFIICCLFHFVIPLLPFAVEFFADGHVSVGTLTVGSAVYVMAIGASSRNPAIFAISVLLGLVYTALFGLITAKVAAASVRGPSVVWWSLGCVVFFHVLERYNRHVMERTPYWEFTTAQGEAKK